MSLSDIKFYLGSLFCGENLFFIDIGNRLSRIEEKDLDQVTSDSSVKDRACI